LLLWGNLFFGSDSKKSIKKRVGADNFHLGVLSLLKPSLTDDYEETFIPTDTGDYGRL